MNDSQLYNRFEHAAKIVLYIFAAALPIFFVPLPIGVEFGREITFTILGGLLVVLWLLSVLTKGEIRFPHSAVLYVSGLVAIVFSLSTIFSKAPFLSLFYADSISEKLTTLLFGLVLMGVTGSLITSEGEAGLILLLLLITGGISAFISLIQLVANVSLYQKIFSFAQGIDFNTVGTINGLGLFYLALFLIALPLVLSRSFANWKPIMRGVLIGALALFAANIFIINYRIGWIVLIEAMVVLFALLFEQARVHAHATLAKVFDWRYGVMFALLVLGIVMLLVNQSVVQINVPPEVHTSFIGTWQIMKSVYNEGVVRVLLGSGPGTFGLDWSLYKDPSVNQTIFWNIRFNQGQSWIATVLATSGLLGALSLVLLWGTILFLFFRRLLAKNFVHDTGNRMSEMEIGLAVACTALLTTLFLYPANYTLIITLFLFTGLLMGVLAKPASGGDGSGERGSFADHLWHIEMRHYRFQNPWAVFLSSLGIVFLLSLSVVVLYNEVGVLRVAFAQQRGVVAFNKGDLAGAIQAFTDSTQVDARNFLSYNNLSQIRAQKIRSLIQDASSGKNVQQDFQQNVSLAIQDGRHATDLNPIEPVLWRNLGGVYAMIIPYIQGSEQFAFASYQKASELDPHNPLVYVEWGQAGLALADRLQLQAQQTQGADHQKILDARVSILKDIASLFQKAADMKNDLTEAHFLLAQTALRAGDIQAAIKSTENAKLAAPFDIGVAFQLGLLYYQASILDRAQAEFERAVSLNDNYSNARYFLGLIYDRNGQKDKALAQFQKIAELNPDNQEVKTIISNLQAGKSALRGIVPPAQPPEKRSNTPVSEETSKTRKGR